MATDQEQKLQTALDNCMQYPRNLLFQTLLDHTAGALRYQLGKRSKKLFCSESANVEESEADVETWELAREEEGFQPLRIHESQTLEIYLQKPISARRRDPRQRLFFIHAPHSRAQLSISQKMFLQILTYHNVMPTFLEFCFPFGKQHYPRDFHLMGFRSESRFSDQNKGLEISRLGRNGRHVELCYSLKSVERSSDLPLNWSIRQCSIHHFLDLTSEQSTWIVIKANDVISKAVLQQSERDQHCRFNSQQNSASPLSASLKIHSILATWAGENWHWYISDLEAYLQNATRLALSASWELPSKTEAVPKEEEQTVERPPAKPKRSDTWLSFHKRTLSGSTLHEEKPRPPTRSNTLIQEPNQAQAHQQATGFDDFSFRELQAAQFVEEKANELSLILKSNLRVLKDLVQEYHMLLATESQTTPLPYDFAAALSQFNQLVSSIEKDLNMQISRVESLLSFTADRKSLLNGVFQYRGMQASRLYAERAQMSAERMEGMTQQMHLIAKKTKEETVSMRIITWVTLIFLPGTFISTLMSTPIVNFRSQLPNNSNFSMKKIGIGALKLYATVSIPLVILTLLMKWAFSVWEKRNERKEAEKLLLDRTDPS